MFTGNNYHEYSQPHHNWKQLKWKSGSRWHKKYNKLAILSKWKCGNSVKISIYLVYKTIIIVYIINYLTKYSLNIFMLIFLFLSFKITQKNLLILFYFHEVLMHDVFEGNETFFRILHLNVVGLYVVKNYEFKNFWREFLHYKSDRLLFFFFFVKGTQG